MPKLKTQKLAGFEVILLDPETGETEVDAKWHTCSGGGLNIEAASSSLGTLPVKYVDEVTLVGPMTPGRRAMLSWVNATVQGSSHHRRVTIKEILKDGSDGKTYSYHDCLLLRYEFPALSAESDGLLEEKLVFKPERLELH